MGLFFALISAAGFGLSGSLARSLLDLGWSPAAVVAVRVGGAFLVLLVPCLILLRRTGLPTSRQSARLVAYGVVAVALAQLCYFSAVQYLSISVALLLEYLAPVLLIGYFWLRHRRRPTTCCAGRGGDLPGRPGLRARPHRRSHPEPARRGVGAGRRRLPVDLLPAERGRRATTPYTRCC